MILSASFVNIASRGSFVKMRIFSAVVICSAAASLAWQTQPRYTKWLNEDVIYIIQPEERAAFLRLNTDEEREKFIEQFWLRRDPMPGTPENEFKTEHYRRIAYANEHFAVGKKAGWQTDRGRILIMYGKPDEIESHPGGSMPKEIWLYHHIDSIGDEVTIEFVDPTGTGDYQIPKKV